MFNASGGTAPYDFECTGELPEGLALDSDGTLSGTPTEVGTFDFTITAEDAASNTGSRDYTLVIEEPSIELTPANLADGTVGVAYSRDLDASGGSAPSSIENW